MFSSLIGHAVKGEQSERKKSNEILESENLNLERREIENKLTCDKVIRKGKMQQAMIHEKQNIVDKQTVKSTN